MSTIKEPQKQPVPETKVPETKVPKECKHEKWKLATEPITQGATTINILQCENCNLLLRDESSVLHVQAFNDGATKQQLILRTMTFGILEEK